MFTMPQAPQATILTQDQLMQQIQQQQLLQTQQHQLLTQQQHNQQVIQQQGQPVLQQTQLLQQQATLQQQPQGQQSQAQQQQQQDPQQQAQQHAQTSQNQVTQVVQPQFSQAAAQHQQSLQFSAFSQAPTNSVSIGRLMYSSNSFPILSFFDFTVRCPLQWQQRQVERVLQSQCRRRQSAQQLQEALLCPLPL